MNPTTTNLFDQNDISEFEKLDALDQLFKQSATYHTSKKYFELLEFINKFPKLSPFNAFLIHMQNAGVKVVMNASKWRQYNRTVKPHARPLVILVPFGPVDFVYDIADTEGKNLPDDILKPFTTSGYFNSDIYYKTIKNLQKEDIAFIESSILLDVAGYARLKDNNFSITINNQYGIKEKHTTLIHEIAHIFAGHLGVNKTSWWKNNNDSSNIIKEIEAESIAYLVCKRIGLIPNSDEYLANYIKNHETMPNISLDIILTISGYIEQMGTKTFKPKKKKQQ